MATDAQDRLTAAATDIEADEEQRVSTPEERRSDAIRAQAGDDEPTGNRIPDMADEPGDRPLGMTQPDAQIRREADATADAMG
jgi:hypothetical protein